MKNDKLSTHLIFNLYLHQKSGWQSYFHSSQTAGGYNVIFVSANSEHQPPRQSATTNFPLKNEQMKQIIQRIISK